jgi:hypothetical protein
MKPKTQHPSHSRKNQTARRHQPLADARKATASSPSSTPVRLSEQERKELWKQVAWIRWAI